MRGCAGKPNSRATGFDGRAASANRMESTATTPMIYQLFQAQADALARIRAFAQAGSGILRQLDFGVLTPPLMRQAAAFFDMISDSSLTHHRPPFGIETVQMDNVQVAVTEEAVDDTPFGTLLRFRKETTMRQPRVLLVAPMSGHFATLLRGTVRTMLPEHDVYITDWHNARDVAVDDGRFGIDEYVEHIIRFIEKIGPGAHVVAVCQPCVP